MKQLFNYRNYLLSALVFISAVCIFSEPNPALDTAKWAAIFIASKTIGFAAGYLAYRLLAYWEKRGKTRILKDDEI